MLEGLRERRASSSAFMIPVPSSCQQTTLPPECIWRRNACAPATPSKVSKIPSKSYTSSRCKRCHDSQQRGGSLAVLKQSGCHRTVIGLSSFSPRSLTCRQFTNHTYASGKSKLVNDCLPCPHTRSNKTVQKHPQPAHQHQTIWINALSQQQNCVDPYEANTPSSPANDRRKTKHKPQQSENALPSISVEVIIAERPLCTIDLAYD